MVGDTVVGPDVGLREIGATVLVGAVEGIATEEEATQRPVETSGCLHCG